VHIHLIAVKVCIVRPRGRDVQAEGAVRQNHDTVRHHRGLVKRGLTIEEHDVPVDKVAVNHITLTQIHRIGIDVAETERPIIRLEIHRLGAWVLVGTIADVSDQALAIVGRHDLRKGQIGRDLLRNTQLIEVDVGIRRDDRPGREVHALTHQITTHTTRLRTEAGLQSAQRTTRALSRGLQTLDVIVHIGRHVVLQQSRILVQLICRLLLVDLITDLVVSPQDVNELVRQIIFHTLVVVHHDRGTDRERRHGQDCAHHPLRARKLRVEPEQTAGLVRHALEGTQDQLGLNRCRRFIAKAQTLQRRSLAQNLGDLAMKRRRTGAAHKDLIFLGCRAEITDLLEERQTTALRILRQLLGARQRIRAGQTDHIRQLLNHIEELVEIDRTGHLNVAKVSGTELVGLLTRRADLTVLDDTKSSIKDAIGNGLIALVGLVSGDLHNRPLGKVVGVCDAKLDAYDSVTHV